MNKTIITLTIICGIIACSSYIITIDKNHQQKKENKTNQQTTYILEPCSYNEIITFFNLLHNNAAKLNYSLTSKKTKNDMTKITWSYPQEEFGSDVTYTFYIPVTDYLFYSHKERYYGCDYILYKGKLQNSAETLYLLIYNHSGTGNYGGIIGAWTIQDNILIKKDCSCFCTDECPQHIANNFVVTHNGEVYLQFIAWEYDENIKKDEQPDSPHPALYHYRWENNSLQKVENLIATPILNS